MLFINLFLHTFPLKHIIPMFDNFALNSNRFRQTLMNNSETSTLTLMKFWNLLTQNFSHFVGF